MKESKPGANAMPATAVIIRVIVPSCDVTLVLATPELSISLKINARVRAILTNRLV